jgi:transcriptional antiterminator NusG
MDHDQSVTEKGLGSKVIPGHMIINESPAGENARWYIVHTYSSHEARVAETLRQRVTTLGQQDKVFELLIPTQDKIQIKQGKKSTVKEKIFPGYLLIKMIVDDESWLVVRTTQGVTGFVGVGNKPTPLTDAEVAAIKQYIQIGAPKYKTKFTVGEAVKITDGHFADFLGSVESIDDDHGKLKVLVSIFGRETPVELDFLQVKKI